jgi:endo-1,4-beta-xylanase
MLELEPERGQWDFSRADAMIDWAAAHGKQVHGVPLLWCSDTWTPAWVVNGNWTRATLLAEMQSYIRTVVTRWKDKISSWDVVNEALTATGTRKDCVWQRVIGDDFMEQAFRMARAADPDVALYYNEYLADTPNAKFAGVEALARDLLAKGTPIDGIGLQYHLYGRQPFQYATEEALRRIGALGLKAHISELDQKTLTLGTTVEERLARQGEAFQTIASACQAVPACTRVTVWGAADHYSWRGPDEMATALDSSFAPKPAWEALQQELQRETFPLTAAPSAPSALKTGVKYDRGTYLLSWTPALDPDGDPVTYRVEHRDADDAAWTPVATGVRQPSFRFESNAHIEMQGTWRYRVRASDRSVSSAWGVRDTTTVVDRVAPNPPLIVSDRRPEAADGWYRDTVTVSFADGGDPALPDGSPGSGLNPATLPASQTLTATGATTVGGSVKDRSTNTSAPASATFRVDADPPTGELACPAAVDQGASATGSWSAADTGAGLAGAAGGTAALDTAAPGTHSAEVTVADRVGHLTALRCTYEVRAPDPDPDPEPEPTVTPDSEPEPTVTAEPDPVATTTPDPVATTTPEPEPLIATTTSSPPIAGEPVQAAVPRIRALRAPTVRRGRLALRLACADADCQGRLTSTATRAATVQLRAGERATLKIRLRDRALRRLEHRGRLSLRLRIELAHRDAAVILTLSMRARR